MASEVCPFCGKTYKRLKSHLPHCKAAASSRHEVPAKLTPSPEVAAASPRHKSKNVSAGSSKPPPSAKRTKPKVSEQIKTSSAKSKNQSLTEARDAPPARNNVCAADSLSANEPRSVEQGRVTLQDVKATLASSRSAGLRRHASPEPTPASSTSPLLSGQRSRHTVGTSRDVTGLVSASPAPTHNPSPRPLQLAPPAGTEALRGLVTERLQLGVGNGNGAEGAMTRRRLGQVRLRELPDWLACASPRTPRDLVEMVQRGWQWYHRKYIDVKKGGVAGVGLLLAGYCVLSYAWSSTSLWRRPGRLLTALFRSPTQSVIAGGSTTEVGRRCLDKCDWVSTAAAAERGWREPVAVCLH